MTSKRPLALQAISSGNAYLGNDSTYTPVLKGIDCPLREICNGNALKDMMMKIKIYRIVIPVA